MTLRANVTSYNYILYDNDSYYKVNIVMAL